MGQALSVQGFDSQRPAFQCLHSLLVRLSRPSCQQQPLPSAAPSILLPVPGTPASLTLALSPQASTGEAVRALEGVNAA